jgi:hypothetical protein
MKPDVLQTQDIQHFRKATKAKHISEDAIE